MWRQTAAVLRWIGGAVTVISLVVGLFQLQEIYKSWQQRRDTVEELVRAAHLQTDLEQHELAWSLLLDARAIDPSSQLIRNAQGEVAMQWLRKRWRLGTVKDKAWLETVGQILPVLSRITASRQVQRSADALAHIALARKMLNPKLEADPRERLPLDKALQLDPNNPYAHALMAHWILGRKPDKKDAFETTLAGGLKHFEAADDSGRSLEFIRIMQIQAVTSSDVPAAWAAGIKLSHRMVQAGEDLPKSLRHAFFRKLCDLHIKSKKERKPKQWQSITGALAPEDLSATVAWLGHGRRRDTNSQYLEGALAENAAQLNQALEIFRVVSTRVSSTSDLKKLVDRDIARIRTATIAETHGE